MIRNDDALRTLQAVDYLVALGTAPSPPSTAAPTGAEDRRDGYRAATTDHGLEGEICVIPGGYTEDEGAVAAGKLLAEPLPMM